MQRETPKQIKSLQLFFTLVNMAVSNLVSHSKRCMLYRTLDARTFFDGDDTNECVRLLVAVRHTDTHYLRLSDPAAYSTLTLHAKRNYITVQVVHLNKV